MIKPFFPIQLADVSNEDWLNRWLKVMMPDLTRDFGTLQSDGRKTERSFSWYQASAVLQSEDAADISLWSMADSFYGGRGKRLLTLGAFGLKKEARLQEYINRCRIRYLNSLVQDQEFTEKEILRMIKIRNLHREVFGSRMDHTSELWMEDNIQGLLDRIPRV